MPTSVSPVSTTSAPTPLSAISLMAWSTDSSGPPAQTSWPLCRRIESTVSAIDGSGSLRELGVHRNLGVQQFGNRASALGCLDGLLKRHLVGVGNLHRRLQVA